MTCEQFLENECELFLLFRGSEFGGATVRVAIDAGNAFGGHFVAQMKMELELDESILPILRRHYGIDVLADIERDLPPENYTLVVHGDERWVGIKFSPVVATAVEHSGDAWFREPIFRAVKHRTVKGLERQLSLSASSFIEVVSRSISKYGGQTPGRALRACEAERTLTGV
jgi:hypothetical protein